MLAGRGATALVVRGRDGLDEITTADATDVWAASGEGIRKTAFDTARFGLRRARPGNLVGSDAAYNAKVVRSVVGGEPGPALDAVPANAAGALAACSGAASTGGFEDSAASTAAMTTARCGPGRPGNCSARLGRTTLPARSRVACLARPDRGHLDVDGLLVVLDHPGNRPHAVRLGVTVHRPAEPLGVTVKSSP